MIAPLSERDREAIISAYPDTLAPAEVVRRYRQWVEEGIAEMERWLHRQAGRAPASVTSDAPVRIQEMLSQPQTEKGNL